MTGEVEPGASSNKWYETWASVGDLTSRVSQADGTFAIPGLPSSVGANTITVRVEDVSGNVATQSVQFTKQSLNGSDFYGYDGNGNLINEIVWTDGAAVTNVYSYDLENRLVKATSNGVTVLECWYDGVGRRIAKREILGGVTHAVQYVWEGWSILAVLDETGALLESYTRGVGVAYDVGSLVAVRHHSGTHSGSTYYLHHNHRGDVTAVRSGSTTLATYSYAAYGAVADATGSYQSRFGFSSKERDDATGLLYFGFRYYAAEDGRWTTRDPIGLAGGVNLYGFCSGNPQRFVDAFGLCEEIGTPGEGSTPWWQKWMLFGDLSGAVGFGAVKGIWIGAGGTGVFDPFPETWHDYLGLYGHWEYGYWEAGGGASGGWSAGLLLGADSLEDVSGLGIIGQFDLAILGGVSLTVAASPDLSVWSIGGGPSGGGEGAVKIGGTDYTKPFRPLMWPW